MKTSSDWNGKALSGRDRRLLYEWQQLDKRLQGHPEISYTVKQCNAQGLPTDYRISYRLRSICGVEAVEQLEDPEVDNPPLFADCFRLQLLLPAGYPRVDAPARFQFQTRDPAGAAIAHPWHPNIRYFGPFAGRVCLNMPDSYTDLAWGVERIAHYLRYDCYHAIAEPPYPEDPRVAAWVREQGEPNGWIYFDQTTGQGKNNEWYKQRYE